MMKKPAITLVRRIPWVLVVFVAALTIPWLGNRYDTFLATQIAISALFAMSLNLLLGTTGLVSFGHVAYFGIGSYVCGILMKTYGGAVRDRAAGRGRWQRARRAGVRLLLRAPDQDLLRHADARLLADRLGDLLQMERRHRRRSGTCPTYPILISDWMSQIPFLGDLRIAEQFYVLTLIVVMLSLAAMQRIIGSPFGLMLTTIRENPERAASIGLNVRGYELAAFVIAGGFAGIAGALFGIFNRGVFADFVYWPKSAEVMIMTILGGIDHFWGPVVGAATLVLLNQEITSYTEYWPFVLGIILSDAAVRLPRRNCRRPDDRLGVASPQGRRACRCLKCTASPSPSAAFAPCPTLTWRWPRARSPR